MTQQRSAIFAEPVRTAIGTFGGSLKDIPATGLGAQAINAASPAPDFAQRRWKPWSWAMSSKRAIK